MDVRLVKIDRQNFDATIALELRKDQEQNLPSNVFSIAESTTSQLFHPRAITVNGTVVGFLMYEFGEVGNYDEGECAIWRFMIDKNHQNTGIGKIAMGLVIEEIKAHNKCHLIEIYYDPNNVAAAKLYTGYGFKTTGSRDDGDVIGTIKIQQSTTPAE